MKLTSKINEEMIYDEIRYLVIESDENDTKGCFLFYHKSLDTPCESDLWFVDIEGAKRQAPFNYGINPNDWLISEL